MWKKLQNTTQKAGVKIAHFVHDIKTDERGLSGVVVAILLILVAVLAIVLIWTFLGDWLAELWEQITTTGTF